MSRTTILVGGVVLVLGLTACTSSGDSVSASGAALEASDGRCAAGACAARPIIFVHGHGGGNEDCQTIYDTLIAEDGRWDARVAVGTADHGSWKPNSIPRRSWLFTFDYYNLHGDEPIGAYSAGPGRIGSDSTFACAAPAGHGHLVPDSPTYDAEVTHDFSADLAALVDDVLRATGASQVDIATHSLGGLVVRSYLAFLGGSPKVNQVMLLASPTIGVPYATLASGFDGKPWMEAHEWTELDQLVDYAKSKFSRCGTDEPAKSWPVQLLASELALPRGERPTFHCVAAANDGYMAPADAQHPWCVDQLVVPAVDHHQLIRDRLTIDTIAATLGGHTVTR